MKITVLGSGGFGYPLGFCCCEYCNKARELKGKNIRKRASLLINDELIVDLTPDTQTALTMYDKNMGNVKYLLQTHTHLDHFDTNIFNTIDSKYAKVRKLPLYLVGSDLCLKDIQIKSSRYERNFDVFDEDFCKKIGLRLQSVNHGEIITLGDYQIKAIQCLHDETIGAQLYLIKQNGKTLFYATDTPMITKIALEELKDEKIDCMFLDESFGIRDYTFAHLNIKGFVEFVSILRKNNILKDDAKVYATHITHDGNPCHEELSEILEKYNCDASYDGLEFEI